MDNSDIHWELVDEAGPREGSPGRRLREAREQAGWSLQALAAELKLPPGRLQELESDDFAGFGPAVFVRGYLRRCAALLGLPPEEILSLYEAQASEEAPPVKIGPPPGRPPRQSRTAWIGPTLAAAAIAAVLAGGWWFFGPGRGQQAPVARTPAPDASAPLSLEPPRQDTLGVADESEIQTEPAAAAAEPETASEESDGPTGELSPSAPPEAAPTVADSLAAEPAPPASSGQGSSPVSIEPAQADIRVRLLEDCWLEITDARGRRLAYRLGRAGEVTRVRGTAPVSVFLGNAEGVELTVDGEPVAVRPAARRDGTARLTVGGGAG